MTSYPNFTDPQFVDANGPGGFNAAFATVSGSISNAGSGAWASPGLIAPETMGTTISGNSLIVQLNHPWGIVSFNGAIIRAHGTLTGADTQVYNVDFSPLIPASGSITAFLVATIIQIQQNPVAIPGPPQGHPSYNPSFVPTVGFATDVYSVELTAATGGIDNVNLFELCRMTLTAGQSAIAGIDTRGWVRAGNWLAKPNSPQSAGGTLVTQQAQTVITPTVSGLTHTLPPVANAGELEFTLSNPTSGDWTIVTTGSDLINGSNTTTGVNSIVIPPSGAISLWGNAFGGVWSILSASPNILLTLPNTWVADQTFDANVILDNNDYVYGKDTSGAPHLLIGMSSFNQTMLAGGAAGFVVNNEAGTANNIVMDDNGNTSFRGVVSAVDGSSGTEVVNFSQFNGFFGGIGVFDGWQRFPSGLVIQWFELSLTTQTLYTNITYPTAFPNVCYSIVANIGTSITPNANDYGVGVQAVDQFSFNIILASPFPPGGNAGIWCMAIGH